MKFPTLIFRTLSPLIFLSMVLTGCSLVPLTPHQTAEPLGKGGFEIQAWASPVLAVSAGYGLTDRVDVGVNLEQLTLYSAWTRINLVRDEKMSLSATAGVFKKSSLNSARGHYLGGVLTVPFGSRFKLHANYRFNRVDYTPFDKSQGISGFTDEEWMHAVDSRNSTDLSQTSIAGVGVSVGFNTAQWTLGAVCEYHHKNVDPLIMTTFCIPTLGVALGFE